MLSIGPTKTNLSERAGHILELAKEIAREYGLGYVGTEHLLLAIVREGKGEGARILRDLGANEYRISAALEDVLKDRLQQSWVIGRLPGTPHFRDVFARAAHEATGRNNWQICSIHLLLALIAEKGSIGYKVLQSLDISPESVRRSIHQHFSGTDETVATATAPAPKPVSR